MTYLELLILAVGLCFDTFAVSISGGIKTPNIHWQGKLKAISFFGVFQAMFLFLGWLVGKSFADFITSWDHWIAFVILAYLGCKMVKEGLEKEECCCNNGNIKEPEDVKNFLKTRKLLILCVATSIDAVAVGVSLAFISLIMTKVWFATIATAIITALASFIGVTWGQKLGCKVGKKAEIVGGLILLAIGIKILVEHLFF